MAGLGHSLPVAATLAVGLWSAQAAASVCASGKILLGNDLWLHVDTPSVNNANGDTVDYSWKPSGTGSPDPDNPTKPHLRTTQLSADSYLLEWEDLPASVSDADQNDVVALVQVFPNNCQQ